MSEQPGTDDPADTAPEAGAVVVTRHRDHHFPARGRRITVRLEYTELAAIELAAGRAGLTPTGYVGAVALAAARGTVPSAPSPPNRRWPSRWPPGPSCVGSGPTSTRR
jgi:hypothetical protein